MLSIVRHLVAIAVAALVPFLSGVGVTLTPGQTADLEAGLTLLGMVLFGVVWVLVEKLLKPIFFRFFGEVQPGEVPPDTHDQAVAKEAGR